MFPHTKVFTENVHVLPSVGALVHVTLLCVVSVGQLPQLDAVIEYCTARHSETNGLQLNARSDPNRLQSSIQLILTSVGKGTVTTSV